jgi:hypothetical protein
VKRTAIALALGMLLALPAWADDGPTEKGNGNGEGSDAAGTETAPKPVEIEWTLDLEEGRTKAKEAQKGLFVYLTPSWFT